MDNDVIRKMNRGLGIGMALGVQSNQRFERLRESHRQDAEAAQDAREMEEAGAAVPVQSKKPKTHLFRGEELPGPPLPRIDSEETVA